jgi:chromosome segregation ATPase
MGWAKYFEDIQKLRDHAASIVDGRFDQRGFNAAPELAAISLQHVHENLVRMSKDLVARLDKILELATDPEINRQITIDFLEEKIARLQGDLQDRMTSIQALAERRDALQADLFAAKREIANLSQWKQVSEGNLVSARKDIEALKARNIALEKEVQLVQQREREAAEFGNMMRGGGVRPLRK